MTMTFFTMIEHLQLFDWQRLKQLRLAALRDSPDSFGSTLLNTGEYGHSDVAKNDTRCKTPIT